MRWIILALSLGASITSIIHGVFMLFGSLSIGAGPVGLSAIWLASLPIISAIAALIGGIVAFGGSRWGALFLGLATVLCAFAPRDIWIYGGLYCVGALLCIFLRPQKERVDYYYDDGYDAEDLDDLNDERSEEDYEEIYERRMARRDSKRSMNAQSLSSASESAPKVRRRKSKTCPYCGATVAIEHRFCPECGESLQVPSHAEIPVSAPAESGETTLESTAASPLTEPREPQEETIPSRLSSEDFQSANSANLPPEPQSAPSVQPMRVVGPTSQYHEMEEEEPVVESTRSSASSHRVFVRPEREDMELPKRPIEINPDMSYHDFAQYAHNRRGKYHRRSAGRRFLSILLLIVAVGGALWFLLGLRKLPEGELPPAVRPITTTSESPVAEVKKEDDVLVQPVKPQAPAATDALPAFTPSRSSKQGIITRTNVNMRSDHTTASKKVATLSQNTRFDVLDSWSDRKYTWYQIRTQSQSKEGWVRGDLLQLVGGELPAGYTKALLVTFGKNKAELSEKLGRPSKTTNSTMDWSGLSATFRGENVSRLRLSNAQRELKNGLKVGMSMTALIQLMGYPSNVSQNQMQYNEAGKTGVSVQINKNSVRNITVSEIR
ncbi:MAG: SH3 domain-containing protein [Fretibacterium sp.]|nr:SH3 domain-containing protein [Fretibacterium sp.]